MSISLLTVQQCSMKPFTHNKVGGAAGYGGEVSMVEKSTFSILPNALVNWRSFNVSSKKIDQPHNCRVAIICLKNSMVVQDINIQILLFRFNFTLLSNKFQFSDDFCWVISSPEQSVNLNCWIHHCNLSQCGLLKPTLNPDI